MFLEGKKALVTGSRRGIGRAIAVRLAGEGADVGINDIERDQAAEDTIAMVESQGRDASWHLADIGKSADVNRMVDVRQEAHRLRVPDLEPGQEWAGGYGSRHGDPKQNRV